jgi:hypothetical protein
MVIICILEAKSEKTQFLISVKNKMEMNKINISEEKNKKRFNKNRHVRKLW